VSARTPRILLAAAALVAPLSLAGCSASHTGQIAVAMDPAGRLLAVVAVCEEHRLASLTLTDETTGTTETVKPKDSPAFGATVILTGPIVNPRPEGVFDLLDRSHDYRLGGSTHKPDSDKESGTLAAITFKLDDVAKDPKLRQDSVLALNDDNGALSLVTKADFVAAAKRACS
jgi:hypothetical protein